MPPWRPSPRRRASAIGTLYRHFPKRIDVVEAVYVDDVDELETVARTVSADLQPWPGFVAWLEAFVRYATGKKRFMNELHEAFEKDPALRSASRERIEGALGIVLERAQAAGVVRSDIDAPDLMQLLGSMCMSATLTHGSKRAVARHDRRRPAPAGLDLAHTAMRRLLPWALLLLLGIGTAVGAAAGSGGVPLGHARRQPGRAGGTAMADRGLAATKAAGTAHVDLVSVTASPDPNMRGSGAGSGVVNFATGDFRLSVTEHSISFSSQNGGPFHPQAETNTNEQIAIGQSLYQNFEPPRPPRQLERAVVPRDTGVLGLGSADAFGAVLSPLGKPFSVVSVTNLGAAVVSGVATTLDLVEVQAEPSPGKGCPKSAGKQRKALTGHVARLGRRQGPARAGPRHHFPQ